MAAPHTLRHRFDFEKLCLGTFPDPFRWLEFGYVPLVPKREIALRLADGEDRLADIGAGPRATVEGCEITDLAGAVKRMWPDVGDIDSLRSFSNKRIEETRAFEVYCVQTGKMG